MGRYSSLAQRHLDVRNVSGSEVLALCPFHADSNPSFAFNVDSGLWICYSCGEKGNADKFARKCNDTDNSSVEVLQEQLKFLKSRQFVFEEPGMSFLSDDVLRRYRPGHAAWLRRGFDRTTVARWQLGYDPVRDRLTVPARDTHGRLVGVISRAIHKEDRPRYSYPRDFPKKELLFGSWMLKEVNRVALVEGPLDTVRVWQAGFPVLGLYGSSISDHQVLLLHRLMVRSVVLFFDNDDAGRKCTEECMKKIKGLMVYRVDWKPFRPGLDPGAMALTNIRRALNGTRGSY